MLFFDVFSCRSSPDVVESEQFMGFPFVCLKISRDLLVGFGLFLISLLGLNV